MKDVALKAGVSASTVCRALRANPRISKATQEHVRRTAEAMGYRVDPLLSAFASRRRGKVAGSEITTIAYITNFETAFEWRKNPFYVQCYEGAKARAWDMGYKLEHFWLREKGMTGHSLSRVLYSRGISAICIAPTPQVRSRMTFDWKRFSCATIGYSILRPNLHRVAPHQFHAVLMALRELRLRGYRRIGLCLFAETSKRADDLWWAGMLLGQNNQSRLTLHTFLYEDSSLRRVPEWCEVNDLEVVIGGELNVFEVLEASGLYPGTVDYATVNWVADNPGIAGVNQHPHKVGASAIDLVVTQIQRGERGLPEVPVTMMIEGSWVSGGSLRRSLPGKEAPISALQGEGHVHFQGHV